jgi:hypothetical protein
MVPDVSIDCTATISVTLFEKYDTSKRRELLAHRQRHIPEDQDYFLPHPCHISSLPYKYPQRTDAAT